MIGQCEPNPTPFPGAGLPAALIKVAVIGRPFCGKSLQAQRLAERHRLVVIMPQVCCLALPGNFSLRVPARAHGNNTGDANAMLPCCHAFNVARDPNHACSGACACGHICCGPARRRGCCWQCIECQRNGHSCRATPWPTGLRSPQYERGCAGRSRGGARAPRYLYDRPRLLLRVCSRRVSLDRHTGRSPPPHAGGTHHGPKL